MIYQERFEKLLEDYLASLKGLGELHSALEYMLVGQGKRIRPMLLLSAADDFQVLSSDSYYVALALEFLHTSTLLHDDLPALDNDDYRRGKLSCHCKFSESTAILAGDLMISLANNLILKTSYSDQQKIDYIKSLNETFQTICYGQLLDLSDSSTKNFQTINQCKTAELFRCIFIFLNIMTDKNEISTEAVGSEKLGDSIGQLFQLVNDFLDQFADPSEVGRKESSDKNNNKLTLVSNLKESEARELIENNYQDVIQKFELLESNSLKLINLRGQIESLFLKA